MNAELISIIVPVYNGSENLEELFIRTEKVLSELKYNFEFILVDDGSKDASWATIQKLHSTHKSIIGIRLTKNFGQQAALLSGITNATGDLIITIDDDLQHPPEEIKKLIDCYKSTHSDVVYGLPLSKQHSGIRNISSKAVTFTSENGDHQGSSFRLIKKNITDKIIQNHQFNFLFIDALLNWYTSDFSTVEVEHHPRKKGNSGYTFSKLFSIHFKTMINYSVFPLRMIIYGGGIISVISFIIGAYFIWKKLMFDVPLGYTSLIVAILFSSGIIILGLGVIGLYIHKMYEFNLKKPSYFIQKIILQKK